MKYKYVLLDWDGCLAKTLDLWLKVYKNVVSKRGIKVKNDLEFVEKSFGKWAQGFANVGVKDSQVAYKEALEEVENEYSDVDLYPGVKELLRELKSSGKVLTLLTSSFRHLVEPALEKNDLNRFFQHVITIDDVGKGKPDPEIIEKSLSALKAKRGEAIIVGDSDHDIIAGKRASIKTVLFFPEENKKFYREEFLMKDNPDYVINKLMDLVKIVKR